MFSLRQNIIYVDKYRYELNIKKRKELVELVVSTQYY